MSEYRKKNPERIAAHQHKAQLKAKFGLTVDEFKAMVEAQEGKCAICQRPPRIIIKSGKPRRLCVDHDHDTGKVRMLLCEQCNVLIGMAAEDPDILWKAIQYLVRYGKGEAA